MGRKILIYSLFFILCSSFAFSQQGSWIRDNYGKGFGYGLSANSDGIGDCYLSGYYLSQDSIDFSGNILRNPPHNHFGNSMYIVKYDHSGNVLWARQSINYGNSNFGIGAINTLDNSDNAYIIATYTDTVVVGTDTFIFPNQYTSNCYLAKYSSNGSFLWATEPILNTNNDTNGIASNSVSIDDKGNVFVTGLFNADTVYFGSKYVSGVRKVTVSFLVKYDSNGNVLWASAPTGHNYEYNDAEGFGVTNDKNGNTYITGAFEDSIWFDSYELLTVAPYNPGAVFLVKYSPNGVVLWARQSTIPSVFSESKGRAVKVDQNGNIYVAGDFIDTVTFGSYTLIGSNRADNLYNIFLVKYDSNGNVLWAKQSKSLDNNGWAVGGLAIDNYKHIYLSGGGGKGQCKIAFGTDTLSLFDTAKYDAASIIVKFDSNGNALCGSIIQGSAQFGNNIGSDTSGNYVYFAGTAGTFMIFGKDTIPPYAYPVEPDLGLNYFPFAARWEACDSNSITVGTPKQNSTEQVKVFPNPNNGSFTIELQNVNEPAQVEIYNILGEEIQKTELNKGNTQINLRRQPQGMYFYRVLTQTGTFIGDGKIIIQH